MVSSRGGQTFWLEGHIRTLKFNEGTHFCSNQFVGASWVAKRSKTLHISAWDVRTDPVRSRAVSQLAVTGRPMRRRTMGPALSGLREGLAGRDFLVPSQWLLWRAGHMHADMVARCTELPLIHWCGWLPGKEGIVSRSSAAWLGRVSEDALISFASSESERELQRWNKTVTTNWITWNWGEKKGVKKILIFWSAQWAGFSQYFATPLCTLY